MYRQIVMPEGNRLILELPRSFIGQMVEVIAFPVDEEKANRKRKKKYSWENALKFFDSHRRDLSNFKFNREEFHER